jgi:nitrite reductase/ring-hydroxylating ferredoxin subunit
LPFLIKDPDVESMESHLRRGGYSGGGRTRRQPDVAIFRNGEDRIFALLDRCPHKSGSLLRQRLAASVKKT